jgi:transposase
MGDDLQRFLGAMAGADAYYVGLGVVVREFVQRMQFVETLNELLPWDPKQCAVSPGQRILALVMAFIEDRRALYHMPELYEDRDIELLLGPGVQAEQLNDKALGRALDKLWDADAKRVYSTICFRAIEAYEVAIDRLHCDTTSVSLEGAYEHQEAGGPKLARGFSKDLRPDLLQFKVGATVTAEGIPLAGDVFAGNETDQKWDLTALQWLEGWLSREQRQRSLFVADSALVTNDNLAHLDGAGYRFISRLPDTYSYATAARAEALFGPADKWRDLGAPAGTKGSHYQLREVAGEIEGRDYRLVVVQSSNLYDQKRQTLTRHQTKEREAIERLGRKLARETFNCQEDAETALAAHLSDLGLRFWKAATAVEPAVLEPPRRRGRPAKDRPASPTVYKVHVAPDREDEDAFERECLWQSAFVLISNADSAYSTEDLFFAYRGQGQVEAAFRWLKAPVRISPVLLKNTARIAAFGYVALMAYLISALVQRAIRQALPEGEVLQVESRKTLHPTAQAVFDVVRNAKVLHVKLPGYPLKRILLTPSARITHILELLRVPVDAFVTVPTAWLNPG